MGGENQRAKLRSNPAGGFLPRRAHVPYRGSFMCEGRIRGAFSYTVGGVWGAGENGKKTSDGELGSVVAPGHGGSPKIRVEVGGGW